MNINIFTCKYMERVFCGIEILWISLSSLYFLPHEKKSCVNDVRKECFHFLERKGLNETRLFANIMTIFFIAEWIFLDSDWMRVSEALFCVSASVRLWETSVEIGNFLTLSTLTYSLECQHKGKELRKLKREMRAYGAMEANIEIWGLWPLAASKRPEPERPGIEPSPLLKGTAKFLHPSPRRLSKIGAWFTPFITGNWKISQFFSYAARDLSELQVIYIIYLGFLWNMSSHELEAICHALLYLCLICSSFIFHRGIKGLRICWGMKGLYYNKIVPFPAKKNDLHISFLNPTFVYLTFSPPGGMII